MKKFKIFSILIFLLTFLILNSENLKITATGDIMLGTVYPDIFLPEDDGYYLFFQAESILKKGDIVMGNLEGVISDSGDLRKKVVEGKSYAFRTPEKYISALKRSGFNLLNLANNHIRDFGEKGLNRTKKILEKNFIKYTGFVGENGLFYIKDKKICVVGFSNYSGMNDLTDLKKSYNLIDSLSEKFDMVIVTFHGGKEGKDAMMVYDKDEYMLGEYRGNIYRFAHTVIDAGADLVIGHGPHVPRGIEIYKNKLIAYSLGNFMTYSGINIQGINGLAPLLYVELSENGDFVKGKIYPFKQIRYEGVVFDTSYEVVKLIKKLSEKDFKDNEIFIDEDGDIVKK